jgi:hypothetical protein
MLMSRGTLTWMRASGVALTIALAVACAGDDSAGEGGEDNDTGAGDGDGDPSGDGDGDSAGDGDGDGDSAGDGDGDGDSAGDGDGDGDPSGDGDGDSAGDGDGDSAGDGDGDGDGDGIMCPDQFPMFDKSCATANDCVIAVHTTDCCGNSLAMGINVADQAAFIAAEAICDSQYPPCDCPSGPTMAEDGNPVVNPMDLQVGCFESTCLTFIP